MGDPGGSWTRALSVPYGLRLEGDVMRLRPVVLPGVAERPPTHVLLDGPVLDVCAGTALVGMPS